MNTSNNIRYFVALSIGEVYNLWDMKTNSILFKSHNRQSLDALCKLYNKLHQKSLASKRMSVY